MSEPEDRYDAIRWNSLEVLEMKTTREATEKKPYQKPELKIVKIRPREVLASECHNSVNTGPTICDGVSCAY